MLNTKLEALLKNLNNRLNPGESVELYPNYRLFTANGTNCPVSVLYQPMLCLVLQGEKEVTVGEQVYHYGPGDFFINSVELPISTRIVDSTEDNPYVSLTIELQAERIAQIISDSLQLAKADAVQQCFVLERIEDNVLDPLIRLSELIQSPADAAFLAPMVDREIIYRLLQGKQSGIVHQIAGNDHRVNRIRDITNWMKQNFTQAISVKALSDLAGMSQASLHRHFRAATGMAPLQYQKTLRLQQARKLLLEGKDVSESAYEVGYESPSQFSREYSRMYGRAPSADAKRLRSLGATENDISHAPW